MTNMREESYGVGYDKKKDDARQTKVQYWRSIKDVQHYKNDKSPLDLNLWGKEKSVQLWVG